MYIEFKARRNGENYKELDQILQKVTQEQAKEFLEEVGQLGEDTAKSYCGQYAPFISVEHNATSKRVVVKASADEVTKEWDGGKFEDINPLLMAEFGSGFYAIKDTEFGKGKVSGQGSLNKYGNAFNPKGWSWKENGKPFHSLGEQPTRPMHTSYATVVKNVQSIARRVFKDIR